MKKTIATIIVVVLLLSGIFILMVYLNCLHYNSQPEAPIYPGSILEREWYRGDTYRVYEAHYTSSTTPDEIVKFYEHNKAWCRRVIRGIDEGQVCSGNAKPFGDYYVGIDFETDESKVSTRYFISINWTGCSGNIDDWFE